VGKIGDDLRMDYTAQGVTVGLAARMEQLASPDTIYLSDATARLVDGYFALDDLGDFPVKGLDAPARVHQLMGLGALRTRFEVSRARGLTRFVGRDQDMTTLEAAFAQAAVGNGQVVGVVAPAGTGKSRLCFEFLERCRTRNIPVIEGHALSHGKNIPFLPMLEVFRAYYGITAQDDARAVREKIAGRLLLLDESFREALPLMFETFGAADPSRPPPPMDAETRQRQLFGVLRRVVRGEDEPFVAFLDDLHWLDPTSEVFLAQWVDAVQSGRTMLLVNFRPEFHADWTQRSWYRQIALAPLGPDAIQELLDDLLGRDASIAGLAARIHQRTGGNPFFTEEVVQGLIESGKLEGTRGAYRLIEPVERLEIPSSVTSLLASRIDRLAEREKHVLQAAAVLGKTFGEPLLEAITDLPQGDLRAALDALKRGEFLYEQSLYPVAEYAFKHPLTQEVALGSQLGERRRALHAAAAGALEEALAARLDESAALLAHHWEEAGRAREAAR
jgi:predicted ATPase